MPAKPAAGPAASVATSGAVVVVVVVVVAAGVSTTVVTDCGSVPAATVLGAEGLSGAGVPCAGAGASLPPLGGVGLGGGGGGGGGVSPAARPGLRVGARRNRARRGGPVRGGGALRESGRGQEKRCNGKVGPDFHLCLPASCE